MKRSLYWVTNDLRINDNAALQLSSQSEALICVYIIDNKSFQINHFQSKPLGNKRWRFLQECLLDFNKSLNSLGQALHIIQGDSLSTLTGLCEQFQITDLISNYEKHCLFTKRFYLYSRRWSR